MKVLGSKNNFLALGKEFSNYDNSQIIILSAPLGKGTSAGPKKILEASRQIEFYDEEQSRELCFEKGICSLEPISLEKISVEKSLDKIYKETKKHSDKNKLVVTLGGESASSYASIKAQNDNFENLSILHLGAYSNLKDNCNRKKFCRESALARVAEFNSNIVQVGIRAQSKEENEFRKDHGIKTFFSREIRMGMYGDIWHELIARNLSENVYITFDMSVFDSSFLSATSRPQPGGLFWDEVLNLLKIVGADKNIAGFDIVEFTPSKLQPYASLTAAKLVYKILNYAFINR